MPPSIHVDHCRKKYFTSWEPYHLRQYFTQNCVIYRLARVNGLIFHVTRNQFLSEKNFSCNNKLSPASRNYFLSQNIFHVRMLPKLTQYRQNNYIVLFLRGSSSLRSYSFLSCHVKICQRRKNI